MDDLRPHLHRARRRLVRHRRSLAAAAAGITVLAVLHVLAPPPAVTTPVLVASRDLTPGDVVHDGDVRVIELPRAVVPRGVLDDEGSAVGRTLTGPVMAHEIITSVRLVGDSFVAALGPGLVVAPVRMADPEAVSLLHVGDRIDVYAATAQGSTAPVVVENAWVATIPQASTAGGRAGSEGALVVLAVSPDEAGRLTQQASRAPLSFTILA